MGGNSESLHLKPRVQINISEELRSFVWTPMKTSSTHSNMVFTLFGFEYFHTSYDRKQVYQYSEFPQHLNTCDLFQNHENYILISTARNPLHKIFSAYLYMNRSGEISPSGFKQFFSEQQDIPHNTLTTEFQHIQRRADFYVRVENLFEDYVKIPFIKHSKLTSSGALRELCERKKNYTNRNLDIKGFYTPDMIDYVYQNNKDYYKFLNYQPKL